LSSLSSNYLSELLPDILEDFQKRGKEAAYFDDVALWAKEKLDLDLWSKQIEIADAIATGPIKSIAVRAGHGVGKSFLAGILACWWIDTRPIQYVFVASTAPSADQVGAILWREIRRFHSVSHARFKEGKIDRPLPGYITMDNKWRDDLGNLIGQGRKPPDHSEDAFQGIHAEYVLAIGDEACGLSENMIDSLSNITSNEKSRRLLIANPTNPRSRLGAIFREDTGAWSLHHISVLHSPNFHGGGVCDCPEHRNEPHGLGLSRQALASLTDQSYVEEKKLEYGEGSARYKARVLGEFAFDAGNTLFEAYDIAQAIDASCWTSTTAKVVLGVDVARSKTGDSTFVYSYTTGLMREWLERKDKDALVPVVGEVGERVGGQLRFVDSFRGVPLVDRIERDGSATVGQATLIHQHAIELGATEVRVDKGGLGVGLIDGLMALSYGHYDVIEMVGGGPTPDARAWYNNRAFQYDQMKRRFFAGEIDIDPEDRILIEQLEDILFESKDPYGAMLIESKDSMKKRGIKSPDAADAAWYACADLSYLTEGPLAGKQAGDLMTLDEFDLMQMDRRGRPI
jgi:hypothetical protein